MIKEIWYVTAHTQYYQTFLVYLKAGGIHHSWSNKIGGCKVRATQTSQVKLLQYYKFFESQIHKKYVWEQLTIYLVESCTKGQHPQQKLSSLLMAKRCSGGDRVLHSGPAKWRIPRRRRYFSTVPRRKDLFTYIVQSLLFLQNPINCCVLIHERLQLPSNEVLKWSLPRVGEFMTYSCLRKIKNEHSYICTSGRRRNGFWSL